MGRRLIVKAITKRLCSIQIIRPERNGCENLINYYPERIGATYKSVTVSLINRVVYFSLSVQSLVSITN